MDELDPTACEAEGERKERVPARPRHSLVHRGHPHLLLDVLLERLVVEVSSQHVPGLQLAHPEVIRRERLALYLHSSAPRRHTYTNAIISSTTNTIVSLIANVPNARSCTAIG